MSEAAHGHLPRRAPQRLRAMGFDNRHTDRDREAYEIERALADRLRRSTKEDRPRIAGEVYADLYRLVPSHPDLTRSKAERNQGAATQVYSYERWVSDGAAVLEVGAGSCDVIRRLGEKYPSARFAGMDVARDPLASSGKPLPANVRPGRRPLHPVSGREFRFCVLLPGVRALASGSAIEY